MKNLSYSLITVCTRSFFSDDSFAVAYTVQDTGGGGYGGGYGRRLNSNDDLHERVQWFNSDLTKRGDATGSAIYDVVISRDHRCGCAGG